MWLSRRSSRVGVALSGVAISGQPVAGGRYERAYTDPDRWVRNREVVRRVVRRQAFDDVLDIFDRRRAGEPCRVSAAEQPEHQRGAGGLSQDADVLATGDRAGIDDRLGAYDGLEDG